MEYSKIKDSNLAKFKPEVFFKSNFVVNKQKYPCQNIIPTSLKNIVNETTNNLVIIQDGSVVYKNIQVSLDETDQMINYKNIKNTTIRTEFIDNNYVGNLVVYVKDNYADDNRLNIVNLTTVDNNIRKINLIVENNVETFIDVYNYSTIASYSNDMIGLIIKKNAKVNFTLIDNLNSESISYNVFKSVQLQDSSLNMSYINLNNKTVFNDMFIELLEENAFAKVKNISVQNREMLNNTNVNIYHSAKRTTSVIDNYAIAKDQSQIVFNNMSKIEKFMAKSDCSQKTTGVILSNKAKISANPFLYTDNYDVKASHGASIGKFSDDDIFYLMSRGLTRSESENLIIKGIIDPVIKDIDGNVFKVAVEEELSKRLGEIYE